MSHGNVGRRGTPEWAMSVGQYSSKQTCSHPSFSPFFQSFQSTCFILAPLGPNFLTPTLSRTRGSWVGFQLPHSPSREEGRACPHLGSLGCLIIYISKQARRRLTDQWRCFKPQGEAHCVLNICQSK